VFLIQHTDTHSMTRARLTPGSINCNQCTIKRAILSFKLCAVWGFYQ